MNVDESRNAKEPTGLLRALFNVQLHDSRAWFLYSLGREHGGSYFGERMVFFGESNRREFVLVRQKMGKLASGRGFRSA
ncbi:T6SS phospholipase effector Tle1-like catalytic domain-containing protein [Pseudomonas fluorescens]|uniref:T6SS phospholipase effector Tle1-like catalytic domain-containing protein n=1 Tax=Pseudomonas fluorescens TaxID=294 RepID=UPI003F9E7AA5